MRYLLSERTFSRSLLDYQIRDTFPGDYNLHLFNLHFHMVRNILFDFLLHILGYIVSQIDRSKNLIVHMAISSDRVAFSTIFNATPVPMIHDNINISQMIQGMYLVCAVLDLR